MMSFHLSNSPSFFAVPATDSPCLRDICYEFKITPGEIFTVTQPETNWGRTESWSHRENSSASGQTPGLWSRQWSGHHHYHNYNYNKKSNKDGGVSPESQYSSVLLLKNYNHKNMDYHKAIFYDKSDFSRSRWKNLFAWHSHREKNPARLAPGIFYCVSRYERRARFSWHVTALHAGFAWHRDTIAGNIGQFVYSLCWRDAGDLCMMSCQ